MAGTWQQARSLGPDINSTYLEFCPIVSPDGRHFFFTSNRRAEADATARTRTPADLLTEFERADSAIVNGLGNIYWMKTTFLEALRPPRRSTRRLTMTDVPPLQIPC